MAVELEDELRRAMREDATGVSAPPTLLADVRTRHRRRTRRTQVVGAVGAAVIVAAAVPATQAALPLLRDPSVVSPAATSQGGAGRVIDGVEVTYLPPGLHRDGKDVAYEEGGAATLRRGWTGKDGNYVNVTVIRGPATESLARLRARYDYGQSMRDTTVHGEPAILSYLGPRNDHDLMWLERPGLGLMVQTSPGMNDELRKIAEGLRPTG